MINSANKEYEVVGDNQLAYILSRVDTDYIYSSVRYALDYSIRPYNTGIPNMITACEQYFNSCNTEFPQQQEATNAYREEIYINIINLILNKYNMTLNTTEVESDWKSTAELLYSFLVSDLQNNIVSFFTNFIIKEKSGIYDMLGLSAARKNKAISNIYAKKLYKNTKIGVISANIESVIMSIIETFDITFDTYVKYVYIGDKYKSRHLTNVLVPNVDFVKTYLHALFNSDLGCILITDIKLALQSYAVNTDEYQIIKND